MRPQLALKNIFRSFIKSLFIFILITAVTFSLFSNVMEYTVTKRETEKAIELYDGVGTLDKGTPHPAVFDQSYGYYLHADQRVSTDYYPKDYTMSWKVYYPNLRLSNSALDEIDQYEYITYTDRRYMTSGVSDEYKRLNINPDYYYDFTNCYVIEGTVSMWHENTRSILIEDFEFLAGKSHNGFDKYEKLWIKSESPAPVYYDEEGNEYTSSTWTNGPVVITENSKYQADYCRNLTIGQRYVFIVRFTGHDWSGRELPAFYLTDQYTYNWCDGVWSLEGEGENYLETEKFAPLKQYMELIETDIYTFDMVYTKNMGAIRYFADGTIGISDGRRLNYLDYLNKSNVCVIHHEMARVYGLQVGDSINISLGDKLFEQYEGVGAIAAVPERLADSYTDVTLEIVGIWKDTRNTRYKRNSPDPLWSYGINTIFLPTHLLNADETELQNHTFTPAEFSFVIENVYDVEAFRKTHAEDIRSLGMKLTLDDGNWQEIEATFEESKKMSLVKIAILTLAVVASTCFTVLLYILGRKRDYAIMRVLGTEKSKSRRAITLPLMVITASAVLCGTVSAWIYSIYNISLDYSISQMAEYVTDTSVPPWLIISCLLSETLLAYILAGGILRFIGRKPPLVLLQDRSQKRTKRKHRKTAVPSDTEPTVLGKWVSLEKPKHDGKSRRIQFVLRYVLRNMKRTKIKCALYIIVSALLLNVAGQINILKDTFTQAHSEVEVVSSYAGNLNLYYVSQLQESGYVKDVFYRSIKRLDINSVSTVTYFTNDIERLMQAPAEITFLDGYDESVMQGHDSIILLSEPTMAELGVKLGDTVYIKEGGIFFAHQNMLANNYLMEHDYSVSYEEALEIVKAETLEWYYERAEEFTVVGCIESETPGAYLPGTTEFSTITGKLVIMELTEATLIDNTKTKEYREYGEALANANLTYEVAFLMDTSKVDYLANIIWLLDVLYPVAVAVMLIIGAFVTCLIIVQTSKDIAIMRVLGTSKKRTRTIIVTERMLLCVLGIILALAVTFIMRGTSETVLRNITLIYILYFTAIFVSSVIAAITASRKNVLELLQTKE